MDDGIDEEGEIEETEPEDLEERRVGSAGWKCGGESSATDLNDIPVVDRFPGHEDLEYAVCMQGGELLKLLK